MYRKILLTMITGLTLCGVLEIGGFAAEESAENLIEYIPTIQAFRDEAVPEEDITSIVMAGVNAPSAMNKQPWHFSVITDQSVLQDIANGMGGGMPGGMKPTVRGDENPSKPEGTLDKEGNETSSAPAAPTSTGAKAGIADAPLVIVISCTDGSDLDAGLATQNMSAEAALLGYGTKIISSPTMALNGERQAEYKDLLGIPEDMSAVCMLLVGKTDADAYDAVSGATTRNTFEDTVTYINEP